ncbi:PREDICTED: cyclin-dependent kinase inhibitor 1-like [Branchiostoma belcheri]|uniref:Cyclin-dependent kinase inhibitor 1-like n=1 Tax=Branchiostoma belcheri TaxID=7741 RepID=A0A6P4ZMR9_BRABE|nr:PREDICTED: cyclin-dependent kinase inhibitor 1-like [Branchiostoma belcheri]
MSTARVSCPSPELRRARPARPVGMPRSSACRRLFGPVDHEELERDLRSKIAAIHEESRQKYNFDFEAERPLDGRFEWERVSDAPSFYIGRVNISVSAAPTAAESHTPGQLACTAARSTTEGSPGTEREAATGTVATNSVCVGEHGESRVDARVEDLGAEISSTDSAGSETQGSAAPGNTPDSTPTMSRGVKRQTRLTDFHSQRKRAKRRQQQAVASKENKQHSRSETLPAHPWIQP